MAVPQIRKSRRRWFDRYCTEMVSFAFGPGFGTYIIRRQTKVSEHVVSQCLYDIASIEL